MVIFDECNLQMISSKVARKIKMYSVFSLFECICRWGTLELSVKIFLNTNSFQFL